MTEKLYVDDIYQYTQDRALSEEAKKRLKDSKIDYGHLAGNKVNPRQIKIAHELRVFGVLSLLTVESKILGSAPKSSFTTAEIMARHNATDCEQLYKEAIEQLLTAKLIKSYHNGKCEQYYIDPDVGVGDAFDITTTTELKNIIIANEDGAEKAILPAVVLPGLEDLIQAVNNQTLFYRPDVLGIAAISVGLLLSLFGVLFFGTPGVNPPSDLLVAAGMALAIGLVSIPVGKLQRICAAGCY